MRVFLKTKFTRNSCSISVLTKEQKIELIDSWYGFDPINDEEEKIMCHSAVIHNEQSAKSNAAVHKREWLAQMRPSEGCKELCNEKNCQKRGVCSDSTES